MPYGCRSQHSAKDADIASLLTLYLTCTHFGTFFSNVDDCKQIKDIRNITMHSATMEMETSDRDSYIKAIIKLLEDPTHLTNMNGCQEAVRKINELVTGKLELSQNKELELRVLNNKLRCLEDLADQLTTSQDDQSSKIDTLNEAYGKVDSEIEKVKEGFKTFDEFLKDYKIHGVSNAKMSEVHGKLSSLGKELDVLKEDQTKKFEEFHLEQKEHKRQLESHKRKFEGLQEHKIPEKKRREYSEADIEDVRRKLIQLYKDNCQRVPVYPMISEVTVDLQNVYVKPKMQVIHERYIELRRTSVYGFKDIFYKDNVPCRNIYVTGDAGIGKSMYCKNMVNTWCRAHAQWADIQTDEEKIMCEFPLLFYISLRYAVDDRDINQMMSSQLEVENAEELLKTVRCLVVLDGLDEWIALENTKGSRFVSKGLPQRSLNGNFTVMTTCRPWKLEQLRLKDSEIDNHISFMEQDETLFETLSEKVLTIMNETHNTEKRVADFIKYMDSRNIGSDLKTPALLSMLVCLWYYGNPFGNSKCEIYSGIIDKQIELAEQKSIPQSNVSERQTNAQTHTQSTTEVFSHSSDQTQYCLPTCFKNSKACTKYSNLLISLSKVALNLLFHENRESSLAFDHSNAEIYGMPPHEMTICLKMGLLTQNKIFVRFDKRSKSISFIHKTHQEFLAAMYLATLDQKSAYDFMTSKGNGSLDKYLEMSNVLQFLNGMKSKLGTAILSHIRATFNTDNRVKDYRLSFNGPYDVNAPLLRSVQHLFIDCEDERLANNLPVGEQSLDDIVLFQPFDLSPLYHLMKHWEALKPKDATSISLCTMHGNEDAKYNQVFDCAIQSVKLKKIYIYDSGLCMNVNNIYSTVLKTCSTLTCLVLGNVDLSCLGSNLENLLTKPHLLSFGLAAMVKLTHEQFGIVSKMLSQTKSLLDLRLDGMFLCKDHLYDKHKCTFDVDVSGNTALRYICIADAIGSIRLDANNLVILMVGKFHLPGVAKSLLECLKRSPKLEEINIRDFVHEVDKTGSVEIFPELTNVRIITLKDMDYTGIEVRFPKSMTQLECVHIKNVRVNNSTLRRMVDSLPTQTVEIWLVSMKIIHDENDEELVKDYIRRDNKFKIILDEPEQICFLSGCERASSSDYTESSKQPYRFCALKYQHFQFQ